jgi:hypothetical protein
MNPQTLRYVHIVLFVLGLALLVGGGVAGKRAIAVVGLVVAAVSLYLWWKENRRQSAGEQKEP